MKTLDRYIIGQYLVNYLILVFVSLSLYVLVDLILDMDEFIKAGRQHKDRFGEGDFALVKATLWFVVDYYGPMSVFVYVFFSGIIAVGAMGFTFMNLNRAGEMLAALASGVSMYRIAAPAVLVGVLLNLGVLPLHEKVLPVLTNKLAKGKSEIEDLQLRSYPLYFVPDGQGFLVSAGAFDPEKRELHRLSILERDARGHALRRITAAQAYWDPAREGGGWVLVQGESVTPSASEGLDAAPGVEGGVRPEDFFATDLSPRVLFARRADHYPYLLSVAELRQLAGNDALDALQQRRVLNVMHSRFSQQVVNFLIMLMVLPALMMRESANRLGRAVVAAVICLGGWAAGMLIIQLGVAQLNPLTAAWLPVIIYLPLSAVAIAVIKT